MRKQMSHRDAVEPECWRKIIDENIQVKTSAGNLRRNQGAHENLLQIPKSDMGLARKRAHAVCRRSPDACYMPVSVGQSSDSDSRQPPVFDHPGEKLVDCHAARVGIGGIISLSPSSCHNSQC
jgi:hypothetical protein